MNQLEELDEEQKNSRRADQKKNRSMGTGKLPTTCELDGGELCELTTSIDFLILVL